MGLLAHRTSSLALLLFMTAARALAGDPELTREYELKAAFLYHFTNFVDWPASSATRHPESFQVCVISSASVAQTLQAALSSRQVRGLPIEVSRVTGVPEAPPCRIIFIGASERSRLQTVKRGVANSPVLLVSEASDFGRPIGTLNFVVDDDLIRLEIDPAAARRANLRISSRLLGLAQITPSVVRAPVNLDEKSR